MFVIFGRWLSDVFNVGSTEGLSLIDLVTPAAIVTGVFSCGMISWINIWMDRRFLQKSLRMNVILGCLNLFAGGVFFVVGLRSLYDIPWLGNYLWLVIVIVFGLGVTVSLVAPPKRVEPNSWAVQDLG